MKLFLTSAGIVPEVRKDFLKLFGRKPSKSKLCFIATASDLSPNKSYVEMDVIRLKRLGFNIHELDLKKESENSLKKKLDNFDIVYVEGGNTYYLMKYVRKSGFEKAVKQFLRRGGIYVGVSAGSIISGPNIEPAGWKHADRNTVKLKDLNSLKLVPFLITPHLDSSNAGVITKCATETKHPVVALTDQQAVMVDGKKTRFIGPGKVLKFNMK